MTRNPARASQSLSNTSRRARGILIGALLLGAGLLAGASPAAAACSGTTVEQADNTALGRWQYRCQLHCRDHDSPDRVRVLSSFVLIGRTDAMTCRARCAQNHRCRAVGWWDYWVEVDGRLEVHRYCTLYGEGDFETTDTAAGPGGIDTHVLCILEKWPLKTPDPRDLDLRIDPRDQYRPGVPGPGLPKK